MINFASSEDKCYRCFLGVCVGERGGGYELNMDLCCFCFVFSRLQVLLLYTESK